MPISTSAAITAWRALEQKAGLAPVPALALTANAFREDREACLVAGFDDIDLSDLFAGLAGRQARGGMGGGRGEEQGEERERMREALDAARDFLAHRAAGTAAPAFFRSPL